MAKKGALSATVSDSDFMRTGTKSYFDFAFTWKEIERFKLFVIFNAGHLDQSAERMHKLSLHLEDDAALRTKRETEWSKRTSKIQELREFRQFFFESLLIRHVDNYQNYLSSLLMEIFIHKPETLKTAEKIDVESVLNHSSLTELIETLAENKVLALTYGSFQNLIEYFSKTFNLTIVDSNSINAFTEAIETRNIAIHNRGIINRRYHQKTKCDLKLIGRKKTVKLEDIIGIADLVANSVMKLDKETSQKLKMRKTKAAVIDKARRSTMSVLAGISNPKPF